jgi:hypothetical protein
MGVISPSPSSARECVITRGHHTLKVLRSRGLSLCAALTLVIGFAREKENVLCVVWPVGKRYGAWFQIGVNYECPFIRTAVVGVILVARPYLFVSHSR